MINEEMVKAYIEEAKTKVKEEVKKELLEELGELITSKHVELEGATNKLAEKIESFEDKYF